MMSCFFHGTTKLAGMDKREWIIGGIKKFEGFLKKGVDNCWEEDVDKEAGPFVNTGINSLEWRSDISGPVLSHAWMFIVFNK